MRPLTILNHKISEGHEICGSWKTHHVINHYVRPLVTDYIHHPALSISINFLPTRTSKHNIWGGGNF